MSNTFLPSCVYPEEVLHHLLGSKGEQPILASSKEAAAATTVAAGGSKSYATTPRLKTGIQVAENDGGANMHHRN